MGIQVTLTVREGSVSHHQGVPDPTILLDGRLPQNRSMNNHITWIGVTVRIKGTKIVQVPDLNNPEEWRGQTTHQMSCLEDLQYQIIKCQKSTTTKKYGGREATSPFYAFKLLRRGDHNVTVLPLNECKGGQSYTCQQL